MMLESIRAKTIGLVVCAILLIYCIWASIIYGYTDTNSHTAIQAFINPNGSNKHIIITTVRLPRAFIAAAVGISLALAGALLQVLMKNPLASPDIMGINAGASFFIVVAVAIFSVQSIQAFTWIAFAGAAIAAMIVYIISSFGREGLTPIKFTLAGVAMGAFFASFTQGLLVLNETALDQVLFWLAGSVQGRKLEMLTHVFPYLVLAWVGTVIMSGKINILMMGDDISRGLGQRTLLFKGILAALVVLLAGGSVAIAGPISFIGVVVPHFARALIGTDYRWVIPYSAMLGGILLLLADISARYILMPQEVPVGVMTAFIGTPFFIYIARKGVMSK
ncbi:iron ABC transporter permease [Ectobacillus antri]|uniref:Iron ABC transporter permease n=1 Tax=Ectobacillus antri TaxID=2486280 RepID=A0ABT6H540_9BACI|nr:iron ABC transporter permease [Ectobacillus antri]MDG4657400.1 iron ABC transporter permease [Ectobacillus antri]MDG5754469.1 iron ABC transporter permease [Ectobacillus antri]